MLRNLLPALALMLCATAAPAFDIETMSDQERAIFRAEIRDYLLENPEVLMEAIGILEQRQAEDAARADAEFIEMNRALIFEDGYSYVGGNPDGDVTVVEFLDYRCSWCKKSVPAIEALLASDSGVRLIVKEFPVLGEQSMLASRYAVATKLVGDDAAYKTVHDALMKNQGAVNEGLLARLSRSAGVDHAAVVEMMDSAEVNRVIATNHALAKTLKIQGTPGFIMGDSVVRGYLELDQMRTIIERVRATQG